MIELYYFINVLNNSSQDFIDYIFISHRILNNSHNGVRGGGGGDLFVIY